MTESVLDLINSALRVLRESREPYLSDYWMNKRTIKCAFDCRGDNPCSHLDIIMIRLTLIDNLYATQMRMRPYGLGELAEAISLFGPDAAFQAKLQMLLSSKSISMFAYSKSKMRFYKDGISSGNTNLFDEGYGLEKATPSNKRAISLISKYANFLLHGDFPIYDSIVRKMYPIFWIALHIKGKMPKLNTSITDYIVAIDSMRSAIGNGITYDELDIILWHVGKIKEGNLSLVLSMEDYITVKGNPKLLRSSTIRLKNPFIDICCKIAAII